MLLHPLERYDDIHSFPHLHDLENLIRTVVAEGEL
jgi:hypothetical protein